MLNIFSSVSSDTNHSLHIGFSIAFYLNLLCWWSIARVCIECCIKASPSYDVFDIAKHINDDTLLHVLQ